MFDEVFDVVDVDHAVFVTFFGVSVFRLDILVTDVVNI